MNSYKCEICHYGESLWGYFIGDGKCEMCWDLFKRVGSWLDVSRQRKEKYVDTN
jgi:hypothetical protein